MEITKGRLHELQKIESKMQALEAAGVDNWEGYDIAMEEIEEQEAIDNEIHLAVTAAVEEIQESAFEPSERGAGFASTEEAGEAAYNILREAVIKLTSIN